MAPSTATRYGAVCSPAPHAIRPSRPARIESGFALNESSIRVKEAPPRSTVDTAMRWGLMRVRPSSTSPMRAGGMPSRNATLAAANAFMTLWRPQMPKRTAVAAPSGVDNVKRGRSKASVPMSRAEQPEARARSSCTPNHSTSPGAWALMEATRSSSALRMATPPSARPRTISLLASTMRSTEPNSPRWATPTFSTTAMSGGAMAVSRAISPT